MKVRDFAAELISEVADEFGYLVFKYECHSPSNGTIVFELEEEDDSLEEIDRIITKKYKILDYSGHDVTLTTPTGNKTIDLHMPESIDHIREWFENSEESFDTPNGFGIFGGYNLLPSQNQAPPKIMHQVNLNRQWHPLSGLATTGIVTASGTASGTLKINNNIGGLVLNSNNIFGFNPSIRARFG